MPSNQCATCPAYDHLEKMGLVMDGFERVVALAGNPNTGKSTLFNTLTGLKQHTGNWPGKTVSRAEGGFEFNGVRYKLVDLPGTYSLLSASQDEEVARDFILFGQPDCVIVLTDATVLERNLNLVLQVLEITDKVVVALNMMDEARRKGLDVDAHALSRDLGVPAIPIVARTGEGVSALLRTMADVIEGKVRTQPYRTQGTPEFRRAVSELAAEIEAAYPGLPNARWIAIRLLDGDERVRQALLQDEFPELIARQRRAAQGFSAKIAVEGKQ